MVEVIVRVQGGLHGNLAHDTQRIHLKRGTGGRGEAFDKKRGLFADKEPAVAKGCWALRRIRNGRVEAVADFAHGGKPLVHQRSLRDAGIASQIRRQSRKRNA